MKPGDERLEVRDELKQRIQQCLLTWFLKNKRDLPWRKTYDPYHVWISEIMLQQTQMERGARYFARWIDKFPDIEAVAEADEQEILKAWEGLGYYSRARNLHAAAKILRDQYGGVLPCDPEQLRALPGIGPYTAAAVSSIAGNADVPVIDANVERVYARLFDIDEQLKSGRGKRLIAALAGNLLPPGKARNFNQALMEFGGMVCRPKNPKCGQCPVREVCLAHLRGTVPIRPVLGKRKKTVYIEMVTGILCCNGRLFIQQRKAEDIWGGLWEFPGGQLEDGESAAQGLRREFIEETGFDIKVGDIITTVHHSYMNYRVTLHCYVCYPGGEVPEPRLTAAQDYAWVGPENLQVYGFPAGHRKVLAYLSEFRPQLLDALCAESLLP